MGKYLIVNEGCDDETIFEMELSPYEYRVLEKIAIKNNQIRISGCQPKISIYSQYEKTDNYYKYDEQYNLIREEVEK